MILSADQIGHYQITMNLYGLLDYYSNFNHIIMVSQHPPFLFPVILCKIQGIDTIGHTISDFNNKNKYNHMLIMGPYFSKI